MKITSQSYITANEKIVHLDYKDNKLTDVAVFNSDNEIEFYGTLAETKSLFETLDEVISEFAGGTDE